MIFVEFDQSFIVNTDLLTYPISLLALTIDSFLYIWFI